MKLIVTGGSGFLGRRLLPALLARGHEVLALARSQRAAANVRALGASPIAGDLGGDDLILPAADAVIHGGAHFQLAGPRRPYFKTNVAGTKALVEAAKGAGIGRFVHVSAAAVVMDDEGRPIDNFDESAPTFPKSSSAYIASKSLAEEIVLNANGPGFFTLALRPPGIWGSGDAFSAALPRMVKTRQFGFIDRGDYPYVTCHVDNVVEAIGCALAAGPAAAGRAFFVNDREPITFRRFVSDLAQSLGLSVDHAPSMPYGAALALGAVLEGAWRLMGRKDDPPFSRTMVRLIGRPFVTSDRAAREILGYTGETARASGLSAYAREP